MTTCPKCKYETEYIAAHQRGILCRAAAAGYARGIEDMRRAAHRSAWALNDANDSRRYGANVVVHALDAEAARLAEEARR